MPVRSMLYRFREAQAIEMGVKREHFRRPHIAAEVTRLHDAEHWRQEILDEISRDLIRIKDGTGANFSIRKDVVR